MERVVCHIVSHQLSQHQTAFQLGKRSTDQLSHMMDDFEFWMERGHVIRICYDSLWRRGLIYELERMEVHGGYLWHWIKDVLSGRTQRVTLGGLASQILPVNNGIPQGAAISPLSFLVFVSDLPMKPDNVRC